jgi:FtsH-binding integral membrane protein
MADQSMFGSVAQAVRERTVLRSVYLWMTAGLVLTGVVAAGVAGNESLMRLIFGTRFTIWAILLAELGLVLFLSARIMRLSVPAATAAFAAYAALNGVSLSAIFYAYTGASVATAFFVSAGTFAGMSVYGIVTKRKLSGVGHYLGMAVWGIIIASVVNLLVRSDGLSWVISLVGVGVFVGLTAYDTQKIAEMSRSAEGAGEETFVRLSIIGALKLYLDFINIFLFVLRLTGRRR